MAVRYDIQLNNNDAIINNNDLVFGESDTQHIADTINSCPGWWKENPTDGVAIMGFLKLKGNGQEVARKTKIHLQIDGYNSRPIITFDSNGKLNLDPNVSI